MSNSTSDDKSEQEILASLDIRPDDPRRRVLVARRGGFSRRAVRKAAEAGPDHLFLYMRGVDGDLPDNARHIMGTTNLKFEDALSVCDTVISKLGYGTLAACVAGTRALAQSAASIFINSRRESRSGKIITDIDPLGNGSRQPGQVYSSRGLAGDPASRPCGWPCSRAVFDKPLHTLHLFVKRSSVALTG